MLIDIVILPPQSFRKKFGKIGLALKGRMPLFYAVNNKELIPHLSLFHLRTNKVKKVSDTLVSVAASFKSLKISPTKFDLHNISGEYLIGGLGAKVTKDMQFLHEAIVKSLYKLKSGPAFKAQKYYNSKQEYYRTKFGGNPNMFEFYSPHFTLARLKILDVEQRRRLEKMLKVKFLSFQAREIILAQTDGNHQIVKILKKFKLG